MGLSDDFLRLLGYQEFRNPGRRRPSTSAISRFGVDRAHGLGSRDQSLGCLLSPIYAGDDPANISGIAIATQQAITTAKNLGKLGTVISHNYWFLLRLLTDAGANSFRTTLSTPPLNSVVVIRGYSAFYTTATDPPQGAFELGVAGSPVFEQIKATLPARIAARSYVPLLEKLPIPVLFAANDPQILDTFGYLLGNVPTQAGIGEELIPVNLIVPNPSPVYITVSVHYPNQPGGSGLQVKGQLSLLEGLTLETAQQFVLSGGT